MIVKQIAKDYIDAGWSVVPLVKGEKKANTSWRKRTYRPDDFGSDDGIAGKCGEPSGWRVDVDCDALEAVEAARLLLPNTGLIHGRPGKPTSHYWYVCEGIKTTQFTDIRDAAGKTAMLVEIRSTGGYTALPPSHHPSGETLSWEHSRAPMNIEADALYASVRYVAIAALVGRHWPASGVRHAMVGHLAGFLCRAGVDPRTIPHIIKAAATIGRDTDADDRVKFARSTIDKFTAGSDVTGAPKLTDSLGEHVVSKLRSWLRVADQDAIEEMNEKHFFVRLGKDSVIGREDDEDEVVFQKPTALYTEYANRQVSVGVDDKNKPKMKPLFQAWLESSSRRSYRKVVFAPPPLVANPAEFNMWKGFAISARAGRCHLFLRHLRHIICNDDPEIYDYLMNLLAFTMQKPGVPSEVATVLRGDPGVGKGIFVRTLGALVGRRHYAHVDKPEQVIGHFNATLSGKVIVFMDEAFFAGDKREVGALKRLITEPTLMIEPKGIDPFEVKNVAHVFMATNNEWSVPAELKDRRFFALNVSDRMRGNKPYFAAIADELDSGGREAFLALLLRRDISEFQNSNIPRTEELRAQQLQSLPPELEWLLDCVYERSFGVLGWPQGWIETQKLYDMYEAWCDKRRKYALSKIVFGQRMSKHLWIDGETRIMKRSGKDARCGRLKPLDEMRKALLNEPVPPSQQNLFEEDALLVLVRGEDGHLHPRWVS